MYRLDAVDDNRGQLGVTAYTEVRRDSISLDDGEEGAALNGFGDAAVMALARAVEAMQRVQAEREKAQAERERVQSELIARLVERLAPAPVMAPRNLREVLDEHLDVTKKIDKLAPRPEPEGDADETVLEKLQPTLEKVVGLVELAIHRKFNASPVAEGDESEEVDVDEDESEAREPVTAKAYTDADVVKRMNQVEAKLNSAERMAVQAAMQGMSKAVMKTVTDRLMLMSVDEAVAEVRRLLRGGAPPNGVKKKANGVSTEKKGEGNVAA
jgi:hypothetical protein